MILTLNPDPDPNPDLYATRRGARAPLDAGGIGPEWGGGGGRRSGGEEAEVSDGYIGAGQ